MAIYNTHNPADGYDSVDFHADRRLQSRELNELQSLQEHIPRYRMLRHDQPTPSRFTDYE